MERLQTAIEKARAQRDQAAPATPAAPQPQQPAAAPARQGVANPAPPAQSQEAWEALEEMRVSRKHMMRNRITAFEPGINCAPFDLLRTRLLQRAKQNGWQRVALVSPHSGCGKSTTAANLAFSLSRQQNLRSIIFDFDLRRAGLTAILGQRPPQGIAEVLEQKTPFSEQGRRLGTNIAFGLNNGAKVANPSEILQSPKTSEALDDIAAQYTPDIMLFDLPPLMASDDNFGFLQNVDCALIMVAAEKTPMSQIDVAERQVADLTNVMGIVLNKCRYTSGAHGHEYDYY